MIYVVSFSSTTEAMMASSKLSAARVPFYTIALPSVIKAGCGMALRLQTEDVSISVLLSPLDQSNCVYELYEQNDEGQYRRIQNDFLRGAGNNES